MGKIWIDHTGNWKKDLLNDSCYIQYESSLIIFRAVFLIGYLP